jgi:hypothetical protein
LSSILNLSAGIEEKKKKVKLSKQEMINQRLMRGVQTQALAAMKHR